MTRQLERHGLLACFLFGSIGAAACSSDEPSLPCDIVDPACQRSVFAETAAVREQSARVMPPVRTITLRELEEELRAELSDPPPGARSWERGLQLLGLLSRDGDPADAIVSTYLEEVAAYYSPTLREITVIDRGGAADPLNDVHVLSHEFVHYLQDVDVDLSTWSQALIESTDSVLATDALVEGEATVLSTVFVAPLLGLRPEDVDFRAFGAELIGLALESLDASDSPLVPAVQLLPYGLGTPVIADTWRAGGARGIRALYDAPLLSAVAYRSRSGESELTCFPTGAPEGFEAIDHDELGFAGILAFLVAGGASATTAWSESLEWRGDRMVLFTDDADAPDANVAVAWRIHWPEDTERLAADARTALAGSFAAVVVDGADVLIRVGPGADIVWPEPACGTAADLPESASVDASVAAVLDRLEPVVGRRGLGARRSLRAQGSR